jgi:hypothetical protein
MNALTIKNRKTNKPEQIIQNELTQNDWGFRFFVETELDAFKAAYLYRNNEHGVKVEFAQGVQKWMVTVFNEVGAKAGLNK